MSSPPWTKLAPSDGLNIDVGPTTLSQSGTVVIVDDVVVVYEDDGRFGVFVLDRDGGLRRLGSARTYGAALTIVRYQDPGIGQSESETALIRRLERNPAWGKPTEGQVSLFNIDASSSKPTP